MATKAKIVVPQYEKFDYLFFTAVPRASTWKGGVDIDLYIGDRWLDEFSYRPHMEKYPTQEEVNSWMEGIIFDKMKSLLTNTFARADHEHTFFAR